MFFCGAGVSQQSDLPSFKGLVEAVYERLHRRRESFPTEEKAFRDQNYDQAFTSLEATIKEPGLIRRLVAESLELAPDADTGTHEALLKLATDRNAKCRLVTTNYDRCFKPHVVAGVRIDAAPRLPVPRPARWNSVVHLHGYLDDCGDDGRELVLSSADFGAAYLVDGWATRFLRELFQHFIVLFVGYRAEDLVVKYMLQALAVGLAERGEKPRAFALAQVEDTEQSTTASHLDEAAILSWALEKGSSLHGTFRWIIRAALRRREVGLRPEIERAWTFLARHQPDPPTSDFGDPLSLVTKIESGAWDQQLKSEITALVEPHFVLVRDRAKEIIRKATDGESDEFPIEVDVRLTGGQETEYVLDAIRKRPDHDPLLAALLDDCTAYLRRAMEVQEHFGSVSAEQDWTYIWVPSIRTSISGHYPRTLVTLITLVAACVDSASRTSPALARAQTEYWKTIEYPIFKRLACFGLALPNLFTATEAFDYLSASEFVLVAPHLPDRAPRVAGPHLAWAERCAGAFSYPNAPKRTASAILPVGPPSGGHRGGLEGRRSGKTRNDRDCQLPAAGRSGSVPPCSSSGRGP